jgi:hypothetical protein
LLLNTKLNGVDKTAADSGRFNWFEAVGGGLSSATPAEERERYPSVDAVVSLVDNLSAAHGLVGFYIS